MCISISVSLYKSILKWTIFFWGMLVTGMCISIKFFFVQKHTLSEPVQIAMRLMVTVSGNMTIQESLVKTFFFPFLKIASLVTT